MTIVFFSYIADLIFGDPEWFPHPVRIIGGLIHFLDQRLNKAKKALFNRIAGITLTVIVVGLSALCTHLLIKAAARTNYWLGILASIYFGYACLAVKDLRLKARAVFKSLESRSLEGARLRLSYIVGRDTENLTQEKVIKAAVESIAENTSDGIIAPLFYLILGGPVLAVAYKAVNTLDSMVGHKNERYKHFGWASAKLDDIANFLPSRITGILIVIASFILKKDCRSSLRIMLRDGRKHDSPNSGIPEAAMAGALGVELGGPSMYQGKIDNLPFIGENKINVQPQLISQALNISFTVSLVMVLIGVGIRWQL